MEFFKAMGCWREKLSSGSRSLRVRDLGFASTCGLSGVETRNLCHEWPGIGEGLKFELRISIFESWISKWNRETKSQILQPCYRGSGVRVFKNLMTGFDFRDFCIYLDVDCTLNLNEPS